MDYEQTLRAKLDAVRPEHPQTEHKIVNIKSRETELFDELTDTLEFARYDLDEEDVLRSLKIMDILSTYDAVFRYRYAFKLFFIMVRMDIITPKRLHTFMEIDTQMFKKIVSSMVEHRLLLLNEEGELELTLEGKSLASRIGMGIYL